MEEELRALVMSKKILYLSCHEVLEQAELQLFTDLGYECFSHGAYIDPQGAKSLHRPGITGMKYNPDFEKLAREHPKTNLPQEMVDWADIVYVMHTPEYITENWEKIKGKKVIFRSIGQSSKHVENMIRRMRYEGMKIVRYSAMEQNIPDYLGCDAIIPFYQDPEEWKDWNGDIKRVINFTQSLKGRRFPCHYDQIMAASNGFPTLIYGPGNDDLGGLNGGDLPYDLMKGALRDNRVFIYGGTWPAAYTLAFQEAFMCFPPETMVSSDTKIEDVLENDYEGELITIETTEGTVTCTPNHPFLTSQGFTKASDLTIMHSILSRRDTISYGTESGKRMDKRRIDDIVQESKTSSETNRGIDSHQDLLRNTGKDARVENDKSKLRYLCSDEVFFNSLRTVVLGGYNRRGGDTELQSSKKVQQDNPDLFSFNNNPNSDRLDNKQVLGGEEPRVRYQAEIFRETKNSLYVLVKGIAASTTIGGVRALSLDQKRALWNTDLFYQEPFESKTRNEILSIRNELLEQDSTIKQERIVKITKKPYKGKVYNLSTADGVYWADEFLVHNTGIPIVALGTQLAEEIENVDRSAVGHYYELENIIENGINGFISNDIGQLRGYIHELLESYDLASAIGKNGRETAIKLYGKEKVAEQWKEFLNSL